jgi:Histidinol-phosphate/aromatic aminotransferase and cobyric acid decarboxylase
MPLRLARRIKKKLAWTYQQLIETNRYPDGGHAALKEAIAQYVNESITIPPLGGAALPKTAITADNISVGNGSDELIRSLLIATCLGGTGSIFVANPTFSMYGIIAQTLGIPVVSAQRKEENFEIDIEAAKRDLAQNQNPPVRAVFVVHPNSPTANALTPDEIEWLENLPSQILVVIDEAYFEFSQNTLADQLHHHPNWIILRHSPKHFD